MVGVPNMWAATCYQTVAYWLPGRVSGWPVHACVHVHSPTRVSDASVASICSLICVSVTGMSVAGKHRR